MYTFITECAEVFGWFSHWFLWGVPLAALCGLLIGIVSSRKSPTPHRLRFGLLIGAGVFLLFLFVLFLVILTIAAMIVLGSYLLSYLMP